MLQDLASTCMAPNPRDRPDAVTLQRSLRKLLHKLQAESGGILDSAMIDEEDATAPRKSRWNPLYWFTRPACLRVSGKSQSPESPQ